MKRGGYDAEKFMRDDCISCVKPRKRWTVGLMVNDGEEVRMCESCVYHMRIMGTLHISKTLFKRIACKMMNYPGSSPIVEHNDGCLPWEFMDKPDPREYRGDKGWRQTKIEQE
tara:strand:- start:94 stop:432 length:339 start_codon:yes stop_codon:yes gene_type:complete